MPCGDNRILTAFFDYLADRAAVLGTTDDADGSPNRGNAGMAQALAESRPVIDVLSEIAAILEFDAQPLRMLATMATPNSGQLTRIHA